MHPDPLYILAGLVFVGVLAQWTASRLKLPAIVLLLGTGLLLGPVLGWVVPEELFGDLLPGFVSLAVAIVLFEGGLSLKWAEAKKLGAPLAALVFGGLVVTLVSTTLLAHFVAGLSWVTASVVGAILIVTGPTVIKPMLRNARLAKRPSLLLKWESIVNDALGALTAVIVLELALVFSAAEAGEHGGYSMKSIPFFVLSASFLGWAAGHLFGLAMDRGWIAEHLKVPAIVAGVFAVFAGAEAMFHEAGLLAVTIMGIVLANSHSPSVESVRHFKEDVTTLLVSLLFLVLSARLELADIAQVSGRVILFVLGVLFLVRPLTAWLPLARTKLPWQEKFLIGWIAPRGVVAAAMGAALEPRLLEAGYEDAALLVPILFAVILATVVLHSLTLGPLSRALGLSATGDGGLLIVGASSWTMDLAVALGGQGIDAVIVDDEFREIARARLRGIEAVYGDPLEGDTLDELPFERISLGLCATSDDHYNRLVSVAMTKTLGRANLLQLTPRDQGETKEAHLQARRPWAERGTFAKVAAAYWNGARFKVSTLKEGFEWEDFKAAHPDTLVLFQIDKGRLLPLTAGEDPEPEAKLVHLSPA